jgi:hypothetical protein
MLYAIDSGSDIRPPQSGNRFGGLASGTYQIIVTDYSNDTALATVIVGGNYTFPDFAPTFVNPYCAGASSGMITGNPLTAGAPPFTWTLTNLGTGFTVTQSTDTFLNLSAGNYSLRQFDSCQSFATRYVTLTDPDNDFYIGLIDVDMVGCDSVNLLIPIYTTGGYPDPYAPPFTIFVHTGMALISTLSPIFIQLDIPLLF